MTRESLENTKDYQCEMDLLYRKREAAAIITKLDQLRERALELLDGTAYADALAEHIDNVMVELESYKDSVRCTHHG